ncbi:AzlC family ABC transporter permease [Vineibacter terrae]|uniref:AzlC family ABC transporter permease n=1 Tax=Vineibacter terrae TaxID=2586908 RepID=UPI002E3426FB|nr:AzlC family ABC transporter permease [Vineibacter terrae]HEX2884927.1 AzlC family ABC transporter permease [Vineibacter terrae]
MNPPASAGEGVRDILPAMIAAMPIGLLFGALGVGKGLSVLEAGLMSILVFAGGAQFAALELWTYPVPILALAFSTLLINARHVLMGASLAPKTVGFSLLQRLGAAWVLTDEAWALAERRALQQRITPAYWFAVAAMLPLAWIGSTFLGAWLGSFLGDPKRLGADFAFTALFIALIAGLWKGRATAITVIASAAAAALAYLTVGAPWHVAAGAVSGISAAWCAAPAERSTP